jgi:hypothetical protein
LCHGGFTLTVSDIAACGTVGQSPPVKFPLVACCLLSLATAHLALGWRQVLAAQEPSLEDVLARAATYVADFQRQLSGIVAEESYLQEVKPSASRGMRAAIFPRRLLKSDFLLVRPEGMDRYVEFRDVFEVDSRPVRDRQERVTKLFLDKSISAAGQMQSIISESARYNVGNVHRTMNTPMLPLTFLLNSYQWRFQFKRTNNRKADIDLPEGDAAEGARFRVSTTMWVIEFREKERKTVIRRPDGSDFPAKGRYWIDPASGAVLMTELVMSAPDMLATVNVSYQSESLLGFRVPVEMRERYDTRGDRVEGSATYSRFRQFQVTTGEVIEAPDKPAPPKRPPPP